MTPPSWEISDPRAEVAYVAAQLVFDEGIRDLALAKRKALRRLGLPPRTQLPSDDEVKAALKAFLAELGDEEDTARQQTLRREALAILRWLPWPSYLVGHVAAGTAGPLAEIEIDVFADTAKDVEIFLLNEARRFHGDTPKEKGAHRPEIELVLEDTPTPVRLRVWPRLDERRRRKDERGLTRAQLEQILSEGSIMPS